MSKNADIAIIVGRCVNGAVSRVKHDSYCSFIVLRDNREFIVEQVRDYILWFERDGERIVERGCFDIALSTRTIVGLIIRVIFEKNLLLKKEVA